MLVRGVKNPFLPYPRLLLPWIKSHTAYHKIAYLYMQELFTQELYFKFTFESFIYLLKLYAL